MSADDPEDILEPSYNPTSRRDDAISIAASILLGLVVYYLLTSVQSVSRLAEGLPLSPSLIAIGIALLGYLLIDAGMMRR